MKIVTAEEMRAIDRATTEKLGIPSLTLMENAGAAVAEFALKHFDFETVCAVCGRGNNGGDGFVAARKLHEAGKKVSVIVLAKGAEELRGDAAEAFKQLPVAPLWISDGHFGRTEIQLALASGLILDAIVGTGFKPPLEGLGRKAVEVINSYDAPVLSIDLPSGAYSDSFLPARSQGLMCRSDGVITFTAPKPVHVFGGVTQGPIAVASIGSPEELLESSSLKLVAAHPGILRLVFAPREPDAHKGDFGHVLVVGGSMGKAGAAAMAGMAALRAGAGLVTVACPCSVQPTVAAFAPEIMTEPLPEAETGTIAISALKRVETLLRGKDAVVLGPGLGRHEETEELARKLVGGIKDTKLVLDADGLNAFAGHTEQLRSHGLLVLTPHPGEMSRLTGIPTDEIQKDRLRVAREVARKHNAVVVLKGHRTITASPNGTAWVNVSGNPGMAKGGSGDVLSGTIAAAHAQVQGGRVHGQYPEQAKQAQDLIRRRKEGDAAAQRALEEMGRDGIFETFGWVTAAAVQLHGLAGDVARELYGETSMLATDVIRQIGEAIALSRKSAERNLVYLQL